MGPVKDGGKTTQVIMIDMVVTLHPLTLSTPADCHLSSVLAMIDKVAVKSKTKRFDRTVYHMSMVLPTIF